MEPLQQLSGRIESLTIDKSEIQPRLRFAINVNNRNKSQLLLINATIRLHVEFLEEGSALSGLGLYVTEGMLDRTYSPPTISSGDSTSLSVTVPFPFDICGQFEQVRAGREPVFQVSFVYTVAIPETTALQTAEVAHRNVGGNQYIPYPVPTSTWQKLLINMGYSDAVLFASSTLEGAVRDALRAKSEAEEAARAAKEASSLTGVLTLAHAYMEETKTLEKTSQRWLGAAIVSAVLVITLIGFYVVESFWTPQFTVSQTLVRIVGLAALFGGFGICMRNYNAYQHLLLLNRHRVNIGKTFEVFKAAQPTDKAKEVLAAIAAQELIDFGRVNFPGKDATENQMSLVTELIRSLVEKPKA
jgi:hypothetical protein